MTVAAQVPASGRFEYVDALRGFAIVLVVLGHALQYTLAAPDGNVMYRLIYSFHMPLFMFISGFVYSGARRGVRDELGLKARTLLLPFIAWLPVTFVWMQWGPEPLSVQSFVLRIIASPDAGGLWFLWVLFLINVLILVGRLILPSRPLLAASAIWLLLNVVVLARPDANTLGIKLLCWHFPFFVAGLIFRRRGAAGALRAPVVIACAVLFLLLFQGWARVGNGGPVQVLGAWHGALAVLLLRAFNYTTAFLAIFTLFGLFSSAFMSGAARAFEGFGRISLEIYASHIYFVAMAVSASAQAGWPDGLRVIAAFVVGLAGALLSSRLIKLWPALALLMFGARRPAAAVALPVKA